MSHEPSDSKLGEQLLSKSHVLTHGQSLCLLSYKKYIHNQTAKPTSDESATCTYLAALIFSRM